MSGPPPSIIDSTGGLSSSPTDSVTDRNLMFGRALEGKKLSLDTIRRYSRTGIPDTYRPTYWKLLLGYLPPSPDEWEETETKMEREYLTFLRETCELDADGNVVGGNDRHRIDVDIPRTLPSLHFFACAEDMVIKDGVPVTFSESQHSLRRILYSTARLNAGLGYVQGMNELVAHLFITFSQSKVTNISTRIEAESFFCFQRLLSYVGDNFCRALDHDKTMGVTHTMDGFQRLFHFCDPELFDHIANCQIRPEFYAFRWITLLMSQEFLTPDVLRIWDFLLSFGSHINNAIYYTTVAMLIYIRESLLAMEGMSQVLVALQHYPSDVDVNELVGLAEKLINNYGFNKIDELRGQNTTEPGGEGVAVPESEGFDKKKEEVVKAVNKAIGKVFEWGAKFNGEKGNQ